MSAAVVALIGAVACSGPGPSKPAVPEPQPSTTAPASTSATRPPSSEPSSSDSVGWLVSDSAARTASLSLVVTRPAGSPSALINGYRAGQAQIVVLLRWTIKWDWRNSDDGVPHSLVVMAQREKIPLEGGRAAFSNAITRMVTAGLAGGQTDQTTFEADETGWYWLLCGVPNHALNGEWIELQVSADATTASARVKQPRS